MKPTNFIEFMDRLNYYQFLNRLPKLNVIDSFQRMQIFLNDHPKIELAWVCLDLLKTLAKISAQFSTRYGRKSLERKNILM